MTLKNFLITLAITALSLTLVYSASQAMQGNGQPAASSQPTFC